MYNKEYYKQYYLKNKEKKKSQSSAWKIANVEKVQQYKKLPQVIEKNRQIQENLNFLWNDCLTKIKINLGCQNKFCEWRSSWIGAELDFHHLEAKEKEFPIGKLKKRKKELVVVEINKCCVLCANCHRCFHAGKSIELIGKCNIVKEDLIY